MRAVTIIAANVFDSYGRPLVQGQSYEIDDAYAASLVSQLKATYTDATPADPGPNSPYGDNVAQLVPDANGVPSAMVHRGATAMYGPLVSGQWVKCAPQFRLHVSGVGNLTMDGRTSDGTVLPGVAFFTVNGDDDIYPYPGDGAVNIRVTLTGSVAAEMI